jgi:hypothetical protein
VGCGGESFFLDGVSQGIRDLGGALSRGTVDTMDGIVKFWPCGRILIADGVNCFDTFMGLLK